MFGANDENQHHQMTISGLVCQVFARNVNGMIKGNLTCNISRKNFKFEMNPSTKKTNIDVYAELQRLFFNFRKDKSGKDSLQLLTKDSIEEAERVKSFLIDLKGSYTKKVSIGIEKQDHLHQFVASVKVKDALVSTIVSMKLVRLYYN